MYESSQRACACKRNVSTSVYPLNDALVLTFHRSLLLLHLRIIIKTATMQENTIYLLLSSDNHSFVHILFKCNPSIVAFSQPAEHSSKQPAILPSIHPGIHPSIHTTLNNGINNSSYCFSIVK